jgi:lipopolysaccharide export system permease protein
LALNLFWAPQAKYESRATLIRLTNTTPIATIQKSSFTSGFFGLLIYAENVDPKTDMLQNVFLYDERDERAPRTIIAPAGQIIRVKTDSDLAASIALKLYNGEIHSNNTATANYQKTTFREYQVYLSVGEGANNAQTTISNLPHKDLLLLKQTNTDPASNRQIMTEIYSRWFTALIPILFVLIGIGFGTSRGRAATSSAALITLLIIVPVYILQTVGQNFGNSGKFSPLMAVMIPDLLLLMLGVFAYRKTIW